MFLWLFFDFVYVFTHVSWFPVNTIIAWIVYNYHEQGYIIIIILLLPLGHISNNDGTTDPVVWIEDFLLHIHMARGDDLHAIKYLPLKHKGVAQHLLNSLPENSIGSWEDLEDAFLDNFQGTYVWPPDADDLSHIIQQPGESARKF